MQKEEDSVRRSVSRSNRGIRSEAIAEISNDGVVMSNVKPYGGDFVSPKALVIQTFSSKSIRARIISSKKVLAMATVYPNGDREVIAREDDDDKENQGFPRMSLQKRSAASNILKEKENQYPKVKAAAVESQAEHVDTVASRLDSTLGAAYSWWSPLGAAFGWWSPLMPDANTGAVTSQEGLEMAVAPLETASSSPSSSLSLPGPGVKASHQNQK